MRNREVKLSDRDNILINVFNPNLGVNYCINSSKENQPTKPLTANLALSLISESLTTD